MLIKVRHVVQAVNHPNMSLPNDTWKGRLKGVLNGPILTAP